MRLRNPEGALTSEEKSIVKGLLAEGWRNQDIQALVNIGRDATINSARVTEVKQNDDIQPATTEALEFYRAKKQAYDSKTGLNVFEDERLIRAREAMILAVQIFNSPALYFKTEVFSVLVHIAWTYLLHEYYARKNIEILGKDGRSLVLSQMTRREDCPLADGMKRNLDAIRQIRETVEHQLLRRSDPKWFALFQACCLNFDKKICELFGDSLSLQKELSFALQFVRLSMDHLTTLQAYDIPESIKALDARLNEGLSDKHINDLEYQFRVIYTLDASSKSRAHIQFVLPGSEEAEQIRNVLVKYKLADDLYPHKPAKVVQLVAAKSKRAFTSYTHTQAWRKYKARPPHRAAQPANTNQDFCIYHPAHGDYTYSNKWVEFLVEKVSDEKEYNKLTGREERDQ